MGFTGFRPGGLSPTPRLDELAEQGVGFPWTWAAVPLTLPSHATILTGLEPPSHGLRENDGFRLPARDDRDYRTLAEILSEKGFRTAAFIGAQPLGSTFGLDAGFSVYDEDLVRSGDSHVFAERSASVVTDAALDWLDAQPATESTFVWVHYFDPHLPYRVHSGRAADVAKASGSLYDGEIAHMDGHIGRLLDDYRESERFDRTWIVVCGDHGEGLGDHGELTHGFLVHDSTLRVPLIVKPTAATRRGPLPGPARTSDIFPTVLDALGVDIPPVDGQSLLESRDENWTAYGETVYPYRQFGWSAPRSLRDGRFAYLTAAGREELYDLHDDPKEVNDLARSRPTKLAAMRRLLVAKRATLKPRYRTDLRLGADEAIRSAHYIGGPSSDIPVEPSPDENDKLLHPQDRFIVKRLIDRVQLGLSRARRGDGLDRRVHLEEARQAADRLIEVAPESPPALFWAARGLLKFADAPTGLDDAIRVQLLRESIRRFDATLALRPLDHRAENQILRAFLRVHQLGGGTQPLEDAIRRSGGVIGRGLADGLTYALRGLVFEALGRLKESKEALGEALRRDPERRGWRQDFDRVRAALRKS